MTFQKYAYLLSIIVLGCTQREQSHGSAQNINSGRQPVELKYAQGFSIEKDSLYTWLKVHQPYQGATSSKEYLLVPRSAEIPAHGPDVAVIRTPIRTIVCTSTTHIPLLDYLNENERLVGFPTTDYISSEKTRRRVDEGKVVDLGIDKGLNIELLSSLKPELLMGYTMNAEQGQFKKITELGIPVIINAEYLEMHPLGRAEWIKFVSVLFAKERLADSIFQAIEKEYLSTRAIAEKAIRRRTVLSGIMYGDAWFLPGGKNYAARLLEDAAFQYLWADDPSHGFLELSFEHVYERANDADVWVGVGAFESLAEMKKADHRYEKFKAFKTSQVYNYDKRKGAKGGNEYLELGYLRPDLILKDLVKISNPALLPGHELYFHRQLEH